MSALVTMVRLWWARLLAQPLPPRARARLEIVLGVVLTGAATVWLAQAIPPDPSRVASPTLPAAGSARAGSVVFEPAGPVEVPLGFTDAVRRGDCARMNRLYVPEMPLGGMLSVAVSAGRKDAVEWLLDHGADIHEKSGTTDALILLADPYTDVVYLLLARGAREESISLAAQAGAVHAIDRLLAANAPVNPPGASPLHETLASGRIALGLKKGLVERLLAAGAELEREGYAPTPLSAAVSNCAGASEGGPASEFCMPVLGLFLERGARVHGDALAAALSLDDPDRDAVLAVLLTGTIEPGATAIALASSGAPKHVVKLLVAKGIDWAWHDGEDDAALPVVAAVQRYDRDGLRALLDAGAPADRPYKDASCALGLAIDHGDGRIVELLVELGANVNRRLPDGRTPIFAAGESGDLRIINFLLDRGARVNDIVLDDTALDVAEQQGHTPAARLLHARGGRRAGAR